MNYNNFFLLISFLHCIYKKRSLDKIKMHQSNLIFTLMYFLGSTFGFFLAVYSAFFGDWEELSEDFVSF